MSKLIKYYNSFCLYVKTVANKGHCTCFWDKLFNKDWSECCKKHDEDYRNLKNSTMQSDSDFLECLKKKTWIILAYAMYFAVRIFGRLFKNYKK